MGHVVFSFTILVISFISDGVIPPKLSTIQNKSAMPFIFSNLSKKPSYSFHLDIYIVLNPTSNPNFFISVASITASDIKEITKIVKEKTTCPKGFHGQIIYSWD